MGAGWTRMNVITVQLATQGICQYLRQRGTLPHAIVIGHDHRHHSHEFAQVAAKTFLMRFPRVILLPGCVPTPLVPAAVRCLQPTQLGVMITASHNPAADNGYKVYWGDGAQIRPPIDRDMLRCIEAERAEGQLWALPGADVPADAPALQLVLAYYRDHIKCWTEQLQLQLPGPCPPFAYTAMHGVGLQTLLQVWEHCFGAAHQDALAVVPAQALPDPAFPTVHFPNPEEGPKALHVAMRFVEERPRRDLRFLLANDPDADRFAVAEFNGLRWRFYTGNEVATMLGFFLMQRFQHAPLTQYILASGVSSRYLGVVVRHFNASSPHAPKFRFEATVGTGFKYLGARAVALCAEAGNLVLLAFEEAIGYQMGNWHFDKDGIATLLAFTGVLRAGHAAGGDFWLDTHLEGIYRAVGQRPLEANGYYFCQPASRIKPLMAGLPLRIAQLQQEPVAADALAITACSDAEGMLRLELEAAGSRGWLIFRASGTEPKLKFYSELLAALGSDRHTWRGQVEALVQRILQPAHNGLTR